MKAVDKMNSH